MNPGRRLLRAALIPGQLTTGQQNAILEYLTTRTGLRAGSSIWDCAQQADRHVTVTMSEHRAPQTINQRARAIATDAGTTPMDASFMLGLMAGLRFGLAYGHDNVIRERARAHMRARERERERQPAPGAPTTDARANLDAARAWMRQAGRTARHGG